MTPSPPLPDPPPLPYMTSRGVQNLEREVIEKGALQLLKLVFMYYGENPFLAKSHVRSCEISSYALFCFCGKRRICTLG